MLQGKHKPKNKTGAFLKKWRQTQVSPGDTSVCQRPQAGRRRDRPGSVGAATVRIDLCEGPLAGIAFNVKLLGAGAGTAPLQVLEHLCRGEVTPPEPRRPASPNLQSFGDTPWSVNSKRIRRRAVSANSWQRFNYLSCRATQSALLRGDSGD